MSNDRFQSMFSLWTILSFNILLVGDFAKLNPFVMKTYTNDVAISINQDPLGHGAVRIDGGTGECVRCSAMFGHGYVACVFVSHNLHVICASGDDGDAEGPGALLSTDEELELWRASYR